MLTVSVRTRLQGLGDQGLHFLPFARVIIAFVVAAIIAGGLLGGHPHHHGGIGWLVPVVILGLVFLRLGRGRNP